MEIAIQVDQRVGCLWFTVPAASAGPGDRVEVVAEDCSLSKNASAIIASFTSGREDDRASDPDDRGCFLAADAWRGVRWTMPDPDSAVPPPPRVRLRDVAVGDAAALARILIAATEAAVRGLVPPRCLAFTEAESAANWRKTLAAGLPPGDVMLVAESPPGVPVGYAWGGPCADDPGSGGSDSGGRTP